MSFGPPEPLVIYLQYPTAICCICGIDTLSRWGVPIDETGLIVSNDYDGEWAGKPACEDCFKRHEAGEFIGHDPAH